MATYKSPGVYVEEISLLPPSIAEVDSAVPAFVGYTQMATQLIVDDLLNVATPLTSMSDFIQYFGGPEMEASTNITIVVDEQQNASKVTTGFKTTVTPTIASMSKHILYHAINHFYANGGSSCYVVSVGKYTDGAATKANLESGIDMVGLEDAPTMLVVPEAIYLDQASFDEINQKLLMQASTLGDRFAILDTKTTTTPKGPGSITADADTAINNIPADENLREFGAVYYPFLETTYNYQFSFDTLKLNAYTINGAAPVSPAPDLTNSLMGALKGTAASLYAAVTAEFSKYHIILPPSAAMAGVYTRVDNTRGYWKAPANVSILNVVKPVVSVARADQDLLNVNTDTGKSVNAILNMPGYGTMVMGARTLDGNSNEWRYINVRRFFSVVEESIKKSTGWVVFEPNVAGTWVKVQAMIENYLFQKWRDGALAGAKPEQAYFVNIGLGTTMNSTDILEGRMIIEIGMAVARPAEFIILRFEQMVQTS